MHFFCRKLQIQKDYKYQKNYNIMGLFSRAKKNQRKIKDNPKTFEIICEKAINNINKRGIYWKNRGRFWVSFTGGLVYTEKTFYIGRASPLKRPGARMRLPIEISMELYSNTIQFVYSDEMRYFGEEKKVIKKEISLDKIDSSENRKRIINEISVVIIKRLDELANKGEA